MIIVDSEKPGKNGKPRGIWIWVAAFLEQEVYEKFFVRHTDERCYTLLSHERSAHPQIKKLKFPNFGCMNNFDCAIWKQFECSMNENLN